MTLLEVIKKLFEHNEHDMANALNKGDLDLPFVNPDDDRETADWPITILVESGTPITADEGIDMVIDIPVIK